MNCFASNGYMSLAIMTRADCYDMAGVMEYRTKSKCDLNHSDCSYKPNKYECCHFSDVIGVPTYDSAKKASCEIQERILSSMREEGARQDRVARINRKGVNAHLLPVLKRLRPTAKAGIDYTFDPPGGGKSAWQRLNMTNKPTFQEFKDELILYKVELINALGG